MKEAANIVEVKGYVTKKIEGSQVVEKIVVQNIESNEDQELEVNGVFVEIGLIPNSEFAQSVVALNQDREVVTDCRAKTNIPGLFAAGDISSGPDKQIVIAAGDGAKAALSAYDYLLHMR